MELKGLFKISSTYILAGTLIMAGCAQPKSSDSSYDVTLQMGSYSTATYQHHLMDLLLPRAQASVSSLKLCFKRLRFKLDDEDTAELETETSEDNIDFDLGEVDLSSGGAVLGTINLPKGTYKRIEFDLEDHCPSGRSLQITNSNGSYSSSDRITIKFSGTFTADSNGVLTLGVQQIIDALNAYDGSTQLKNIAEDASGELTQ